MPLRFLFALPALLVAFTFTFAAAEEAKVRLLSNKTEMGAIVSIANNEIVLKSGNDHVTLPLAQVLEVYFRESKAPDPAVKRTDVVLTDDTVLHCKEVVFLPKEVELTLLSGAAFKVPLTSVVSFCREANNAVLAKKFEEIVEKKDRVISDRVITRRADSLTLGTLEGTLGEIKDKFIQFRPQNSPKEIDVNLDKVHGIIFFRNPVAPPASPICKVTDVGGNSLSAVKLSFDGAKLAITTTTGNELVLPEEVLASLDFNLGKQTYLSSLVPRKVVVKSGIGLPHSYSQNKNLDGDDIYLDKKPYRQGLSMHAYTDLEYNLAGKFKELRGVLGIDTRIGPETPEPKVTIYCDDRAVFSEVITVKKVVPLNLDVKGVRTLRIVVSSKNLLDLGDHVTLGDGQLTQ